MVYLPISKDISKCLNKRFVEQLIMFSKTIQAVRRREALAEDVDWDLYKWIEGHPGLNIYELAKSIGWSHGKVYSSVKRLEQDGLVKVERVIRNGRSASMVTSRKWQEFFTKEELEEMQQPGYFDEVDTVLKNA
jgi:DNA-binding MarR family transcriptional regulator